MFCSTRDFHDARKQWVSRLPALLYSESELVPKTPCILLGDMDLSFYGKRGVFFNLGQAFYHYRIVASGGGGPMVGYFRMLNPNYGTLFAIVDDVQGINSEAKGLTKSLEMQVLPGFIFEKEGEDFSFTVRTRSKEFGTRVETSTEMEAFNSRGVLVLKSSALFVQTEATVKLLSGQVKRDISELWREAGDLRLAGRDWNDARMSFVLTLPRPVLNDAVVPSWWEPGSGVRVEHPVPSPFAGRIELYNVERTAKGVRAVILPLRTSEGLSGLLHGGGGASACIQVLSNLLPGAFRVKSHVVRFRRPIPLEVKFVIEWTKQSGGEYAAQVLDWNRNVLQDVVLQIYEDGVAKL